MPITPYVEKVMVASGVPFTPNMEKAHIIVDLLKHKKERL